MADMDPCVRNDAGHRYDALRPTELGVFMKPSEALQSHRAAIVAATVRFRTTNPRVFGSVLHGQDTDNSDLDLLVDPLPGTTLFDLGGLQVELEDMLGLRVDLLTPGDLPIKFRQTVLLQAQPL